MCIRDSPYLPHAANRNRYNRSAVSEAVLQKYALRHPRFLLPIREALLQDRKTVSYTHLLREKGFRDALKASGNPVNDNWIIHLTDIDFNAVSYTHLDVYKRQSLYRIRA